MYEGAPPDVRSDVFALGATVFTLLSGVRPFQGGSAAERMRAVLNTEPSSLAALWPETPAAVVSWVASALARRPEERPSSAGGLLAALAPLLPDVGDKRLAVAALVQPMLNSDAGGSPVVPYRVRTVPRYRRGKSPRTTWVRRVGVAVLLATLGLAAVWVLRGHDARARASAQQTIAPAVGPASAPAVAPFERVPVEAEPDVREAPVPAVSAGAPLRMTTTPKRGGSLWVKVTPFAQVFIDGEPVGMTPLSSQSLAAGYHSVIAVNPASHESRQTRVLVHAGETRVVKLSFL